MHKILFIMHLKNATILPKKIFNNKMNPNKCLVSKTYKCGDLQLFFSFLAVDGWFEIGFLMSFI